MMWQRIVRRIGGLYEIGPLSIGIFDNGAMIAWRRVVRWEWPGP